MDTPSSHISIILLNVTQYSFESVGYNVGFILTSTPSPSRRYDLIKIPLRKRDMKCEGRSCDPTFGKILILDNNKPCCLVRLSIIHRVVFYKSFVRGIQISVL